MDLSQWLEDIIRQGLEELSCCSEKTAGHLSIVMAENTTIMPELLGLLITAQQRIPERTVTETAPIWTTTFRNSCSDCGGD